MSFLRPEIRAFLARWREALAGLAVAAVGLWIALGARGLTAWAGALLALAGVALALLGMQRARFRTGTGGPGVVEITEGQVTYFGPVSGGSVSVAELMLVELDPRPRPEPHWVLTQPGAPPLAIPLTAAGADGLFDVFASLEGIRTERMLAHLMNTPDRRVTIWRAPGTTGQVVWLDRALH